MGGGAGVGRQLTICARCHGRLLEIWDCAIRVLDDMKETVRKAAESLVNTLAHLSERVCDKDTGGRHTGEACAMLVPYFVDQGTQSRVGAVRAIALKTLLKITKKAGREVMRPHAPKLVIALLESLSVSSWCWCFGVRTSRTHAHACMHI